MSRSAHTHAQPSVEQVTVIANERVAEGVGLLTLSAPTVSERIAPGQFVQLRIPDRPDLVLRRPFSVHRSHDTHVDILYQVLGRGTRQMSGLAPGAVTDVVGPLGSGWRVQPGMGRALFVTGGLGAAPLGMLAERLAADGVALTVAMGAPTEERLVARALFERVARRVEVATDDGSAGDRGFVTALSERIMAGGGFDAVFTCGPEPMQRIVAAQAASHGIPCQVSLERLMACGIGVCLSCVVQTASGLKRACVDGPVFDAEEVCWDERA